MLIRVEIDTEIETETETEIETEIDIEEGAGHPHINLILIRACKV